ncbi:type II secretion system secretin GspD [bacterium]|nr:type II secretion system secretin GspD [bacterium]
MRRSPDTSRATVVRARGARVLALVVLGALLIPGRAGRLAAQEGPAADAGRVEPAARAEARTQAPEEAPRPLRPDDLVTMDFQDVELPTLIKFVSEITGRNFVVDEKVRGKVSIVSPTRITVDEAYRVFQSVLQVKGFSVVDTGPVVKIIPTKDVKGSGIPIEGGNGESESFVTRLVPLRHLEAAQAAQVLQPLVSRDGLVTAYPPTNSLIVIDSQVNLSRLSRLIRELDVPGQERAVEVIPLRHANASDIAGILRDTIEEGRGRGGSPGGGPAPGTSTTIPGVPASAAGGAAARLEGGGLRVVPDDRSNSIVVIGSELEIRQARALVGKLDVSLPRGSGRVNVYSLRHANAVDMVAVLADLVGTSSAFGGRRDSMPGRSVTQGGGRFGGFPRSVLGDRSAGAAPGSPGSGALGGAMGGGLSGFGGAYGNRGGGGYGGPGGFGGGTASAGSGPPAIEFESGVRITADPATNSLVISAAPQDYAVLREVIERLDVARRQVLVEAIIFEVSLAKAKELGIELQGGAQVGDMIALGRTNLKNITNLNNAIATGDVGGLSTIGGLLGALISKQKLKLADGTEIPAQAAVISALENETGVNVLSAPTILTTDNEEAEIVVGQNVPFVTSRATNETNLSNTFSQIDRRDVGITLRLTPQISEGDTVRLLLFEEVSALVKTPLPEVLQLGPTTTVRSATTNVVVRDSDTVAIGGLISDRLDNAQSGVPYLTDIPVVGNLFKYQEKQKEKVNLIILLTPHIVRDPDQMLQVSEGEKARFRQAMVGRGRFAGTQGTLAPKRPPAPAETIDGGVLLPAEGVAAGGGDTLLPGDR